ncbi:MAG: ribosome maturation factor RimP [Desulfuromonadales bacterium]|nr:ribosome maturation factor RimP [Desulfuromonadales bacterium]
MQKDQITIVEELVTPILSDLGFELVDMVLRRETTAWALQIFIDKPGGITLDDCIVVSREVDAILEVEDPIKATYRLEVSSPGLDRPLKKPSDFERFAGQKAKLKTQMLTDPDQRGRTRKTFVGILRGLEDTDTVRLELTDKQGGIALIAIADLEKANLEEDF